MNSEDYHLLGCFASCLATSSSSSPLPGWPLPLLCHLPVALAVGPLQAAPLTSSHRSLRSSSWNEPQAQMPWPPPWPRTSAFSVLPFIPSESRSIPGSQSCSVLGRSQMTSRCNSGDSSGFSSFRLTDCFSTPGNMVRFFFFFCSLPWSKEWGRPPLLLKKFWFAT